MKSSGNWKKDQNDVMILPSSVRKHGHDDGMAAMFLWMTAISSASPSA